MMARRKGFWEMTNLFGICININRNIFGRLSDYTSARASLRESAFLY